MKTELQNRLIEKYKEFFQLDRGRKIYTENTLEFIDELLKQDKIVYPIQFGLECENGWFMLLDELMSNIQNHIRNYNDSADKSLKNKKIENIIKYFINHSSFNSLKRKFFIKLLDIFPKGRPHLKFKVTQIKEKFGGLCFYYYGGDDVIDGMVYLAESLSYNICETCGTTKNVGRTKGWVYTICRSCREKNSRAKELKWNKNKI